MKKPLLLLNLIMLSAACTPSKTVEPEAKGGNINVSAPYLWSLSALPRNLQISDAYIDSAEITNITSMTSAWETAVENKQDLMNHNGTTPEVSSSSMNLDALGSDGVNGIYKIINWPQELNSGALAVTQLFGRRYNIGTSSEHVRIEHGDILINEHLYDFRTGDTGVTGSYDFRTVVLHEMGHFLGLGHKYGSTVMVPSIGTSTQNRTPYSMDAVDMAEKYQVTLSTSSSSAMVAGPSKTYSSKPGDPGQEVKILIELRADGECVHKENGVLVERHSVKID